MSTFVETSKICKRNLENPPRNMLPKSLKILKKSMKKCHRVTSTILSSFFFHSSVLISTYLAPISDHFSAFSPQICSRIAPDAIFWPPLGSSWPHLGHLLDPLGPTLAPLGLDFGSPGMPQEFCWRHKLAPRLFIAHFAATSFYYAPVGAFGAQLVLHLIILLTTCSYTSLSISFAARLNALTAASRR